MIHLEVKEVLRNARKAFEEGRLQMQKESRMEGCFYSGPCAIGVSIPEGTLTEGQDMSAIDQLIEDGVVSTDNADDLLSLQLAHDLGYSDTFLNTLEELELKHGLR